MKKLVLGVALLVTALGFSQESIRTKKEVKTQIKIHNKLYAEGTFEENNTFIFKCQQFQGISIFKPIVLTPHDTEKLYQALTTAKEHKHKDFIDIPTLDNKLVHVEYYKTLFKTYAVMDIIDKENDAIYHIFCLPKVQTDKLFNKV